MTEALQRSRSLIVYLSLALVIAGVYWPVGHFEFINYDDPLYVTENRHVQGGLSLRGLGWAITTPLDQWMPVTWLARILEYQLFGPDAGAHHLVNVLFHIVNTLLLFGVLNRMTGAPWRSATVAALFALHPLHVEAVAWVTGLKDVLSTCFWMITVWAYVRYVESLDACASKASGASRSTINAYYGLTLLCFTLGLMSKPMVVTLPFVLLLLDYWPLGRTRWAEPATGERAKISLSQLVKEKLPLFALAGASCVVTYWAQHSLGSVVSLDAVPLGTRVSHALISYVAYVGKSIWPARLAVFYPPRPGLPMLAVVGAGVGLAGMTATVVWKARGAPWFVTGWFLYLGMLVPVIGLVQVGSQTMADRYTYVPLVGLFLMLCWSLPRRAMEQPMIRVAVCVAAATGLAVCALRTRIQVSYWKNPETLFRYALNVTRGNWVAHNSLGVALERAGRVQEAIAHYEQALRIRSDYAEAHYNLGVALEETGQFKEAIGHYQRALQIKPDDAETHYHLGIALEQTGQLKEAIDHYEQALRIDPDFVDAHYCLGLSLLRRGELTQAAEHFEHALRIRPDLAEAHHNLGVALEQAGKLGEAIRQFEEALRIKPDLSAAHNNLAIALVRLGRVSEAVEHFEQALRIRPEDAEAHYNLGVTLEQAGQLKEAIGHYEQALRIDPGMAEAQNKLAQLRSLR